MAGIFQTARSFLRERPGLNCLFWGAVLAFVYILRSITQDDPPDERLDWRSLRDLEAVDSSLLDRRDGLAYVDGDSEPFTGWERQYFTIERYAGEIPIRLFIPYRNGKREGHGEGFYPNDRQFSETSYGSAGHHEITLYESGQLRSRSTDHRLINGTSLYFYDKPSPNRQKKFEGVWEDGVLVSEKWWNREGVETSSDKAPGG